MNLLQHRNAVRAALGALGLGGGLLLAGVTPVDAGTVILSGDSNVADGIDGSGGTLLGDNAVFFKNVLGGTTKVLIQDKFGFIAAPIATLYNGLAGVAATKIAGNPTAAQLNAVNLFIAFLPNTAYDAPTTAALTALLNRGGTVFFLGDNDIFTLGNTNINTDLGALGSTLHIVIPPVKGLQSLDPNDEPAIAQPDPLTVGVTDLTNIEGSEVGGGKPLFLAGDGSLLPLIEDQTIGGNANGGSSVPEPTSLALLSAGLVGIGAIRRRRHAA